MTPQQSCDKVKPVSGESEETFRLLFEHHPIPMWIYDLETLAFLAVNDAAVRRYGYTRAEFLALTLKDIRPAEDVPRLLEEVAQKRPPWQQASDWRHRLKNGAVIDVEITSHMIEYNGRQAALVMAQDITERKQVEAESRLKDELLRMTGEMAKVGGWEFDAQTLKGTWTDEVAHIHDLDPGQPTNVELGLSFYLPESRQKVERAVKEALELAQPYELELEMVSAKGHHKWVRTMGLPVVDGGKVIKVRGIFQDITAPKQLEADNEQLAAQFYQAQKMESIGRLAGGIAHDFNNLLVPILGYAELGMRKLAPDSQLYANFKQIKEAGERAAGLTRQILAFSRRQVLEMKVLDLNQVIIEFQKMLDRLIGEDITLQTRLASTLPSIQADQGQLEQVLLNLVVNARDAMPDGGRLTLETAQAALDETYAAQHPEVQPGPHVLLAVSDTGQGMDAATQERIFEPFFTTKARGQGTGLGLATVFGIVKQHQGNIWVYSEPGRGTTFRIYLPLAEALPPVEEAAPEAGLLEGPETVLVVEDEAGVRRLVCEALQGYGYRVLEAGEPQAGLTLARGYEGVIDLLLTDVIMPQMNGRELYERLAPERSGMKVLYMSGYTDDVIVHHGVLEAGVVLLQKPFTMRSLLQKVRAALGESGSRE